MIFYYSTNLTLEHIAFAQYIKLQQMFKYIRCLKEVECHMNLNSYII